MNMFEDDLVTHTSRQLGRSIDAFVARVVAHSPARPDVRTVFVKRLVDQTSSELARSIDEFVARAVSDTRGLEPPMVDDTPEMIVRLVLAPPAIARAMTGVKARFGLSVREADVLTASLCGIPRRYLADVLGVGENTVKTTVRHAIRKTGHRNLDDAVWWLREMTARGR